MPIFIEKPSYLIKEFDQDEAFSMKTEREKNEVFPNERKTLFWLYAPEVPGGL